MSRRGPRPGTDGPIPKDEYLVILSLASTKAWALNEKSSFIQVFRETVAKFSGKDVPPTIYADSLNKMVINLAETSRDPLVIAFVKSEDEAKTKDPSHKRVPAMSKVNGSNIWIREFSFAESLRAKDAKQQVANIIHEAAHLAGAPDTPLFEYALDRIHDAAGYPR